MSYLRLRTACVLVPFLLAVLPACYGGQLLVVPLEGSHWVNMDVLIRALHHRGHVITVLRSSKSQYIKENSTYYDSITVPVTEGVDEELVAPILKKLLQIERGQSSLLNIFQMQYEALNFMSEIHKMISEMARTLFQDEDLINRMRMSQYDLVLTDPGWGVGVLLAHYLKLPLVYNVRWVLIGEGHLVVAPSPLSYIPMTGLGFTDKMTLVERIRNSLMYLSHQAQETFLIRPHYQAVCDEFLGPGLCFDELVKGADLWLMRVDFVFEFPRPTMPNVIYIGGFQCKPAQPLPQDLEEFVQSSGEHGFILMSLGTFVKELSEDITSKIAAAFAQLPQKVIWKHGGERPATLGNNTLLVDWMPQNDLLGHPKIRLFVAHGGTNGVQEAMYHGVPVVGLPLFFDQYDNLLRLKERGAAKMLSVATVDKDQTFLNAVQEVLSETSYRLNMQRLSRLHRDQPMTPLHTALFWIEFVMRHRGAAHLRTESYRIPWYSYYSVDVVVFLFGVSLLLMLTFATLVRFVCLKLCIRRKLKHD